MKIKSRAEEIGALIIKKEKLLLSTAKMVPARTDTVSSRSFSQRLYKYTKLGQYAPKGLVSIKIAGFI
ncbi:MULTISPECIES: hypothetical protein [unclassified Sphingobacterium]|uniref:hypothetical protein n=1 Tax=unclassified Sphingobacterium TaxID=2609468 RepID=UPI0010435B10|nr:MULTISPECIES: hypothetical protein [unclassified Sphingobacterium]MCS3553578.1 hypothetical protein [Sphingobacterium sp. JUb21]TCR09214.1 hypothetical protein EDF66_1026 [Sphingobacterium sp. JUb20]